ncbi:MAG: hypothetical protein LH615_09660 [Ferruginibacter sp.]|nr:hypothetical protein [Ferruginibacter sp.]
MLLIRKLLLTLVVCAAVKLLFANTNTGKSIKTLFESSQNVRDTPPPALRYPIKDSRGDAVSSGN